jgi:hypothetical protein
VEFQGEERVVLGSRVGDTLKPGLAGGTVNARIHVRCATHQHGSVHIVVPERSSLPRVAGQEDGLSRRSRSTDGRDRSLDSLGPVRSVSGTRPTGASNSPKSNINVVRFVHDAYPCQSRA